MALVDLPDTPGPASVAWREQDFGGALPGLLGGGGQRINRQGNRWAIDVALPPLALDDARRWSAALSLGLKNGVRWKVRQVGLESGPIGTPLVAGAGQMGMALDVDGMTNGAAWMAGQWVGVGAPGSSCLYLTAAPGFADGSGVAEIAFTSPLRAVPADDAPVSFAPSIEGLLGGDQLSWTIDRMRLGGAGFSIEEIE